MANRRQQQQATVTKNQNHGSHSRWVKSGVGSKARRTAKLKMSTGAKAGHEFHEFVRIEWQAELRLRCGATDLSGLGNRERSLPEAKARNEPNERARVSPVSPALVRWWPTAKRDHPGRRSQRPGIRRGLTWKLCRRIGSTVNGILESKQR